MLLIHIFILTCLHNSGDNFDALALLSREGVVYWCFQLMAFTSARNLHVNADTFYYTFRLNQETSLNSLFTTRSVNDASLIHETRLSFKAKSNKHDTPQNQNKRLALLASDDAGDFVIDTTTEYNVLQPDQSSNIILSAVEDKAWEIPSVNQDEDIILSEYLYDPQTQALVRKEAVHEAQFMDEKCWGLDGDHQLFFSAAGIEGIEQEGQPQSENMMRSVRHTAFVASLEPQHLEDEEGIKTCRHVQMSLPGHPKRHDLEFYLSYAAADTREDITFHPIDGYLVVQERVFCDSTIILLDFRPTW